MRGDEEEGEEDENVESEEVDDDDNEVFEPDENVRATRLKRRQLTKNRLVNSIDAAVNIDNYNPYPIPEILKSIESVVKVDRNEENNIVRTFQNRPSNQNVGRNNRANVITGRQGPQPKATHTPTPRSAFELFFYRRHHEGDCFVYKQESSTDTIQTSRELRCSK